MRTPSLRTISWAPWPLLLLACMGVEPSERAAGARLSGSVLMGELSSPGLAADVVTQEVSGTFGVGDTEAHEWLIHPRSPVLRLQVRRRGFRPLLRVEYLTSAGETAQAEFGADGWDDDVTLVLSRNQLDSGVPIALLVEPPAEPVAEAEYALQLLPPLGLVRVGTDQGPPARVESTAERKGEDSALFDGDPSTRVEIGYEGTSTLSLSFEPAYVAAVSLTTGLSTDADPALDHLSMDVDGWAQATTRRGSRTSVTNGDPPVRRHDWWVSEDIDALWLTFGPDADSDPWIEAADIHELEVVVVKSTTLRAAGALDLRRPSSGGRAPLFGPRD